MRAELVRRDGGGKRAERESVRGGEEKRRRGAAGGGMPGGVVQGCIVDATIALVAAARVTYLAAPALPRDAKSDRIRTIRYQAQSGRDTFFFSHSPTWLAHPICGLRFAVGGLR